MPLKRSPSPNSSASSSATKKFKTSHHLDFSHYINLNSKSYPFKHSTKAAIKWNNGSKKKPFEIFEDKYNEGKLNEDEKYLVHWFKNDLRIHDNTSLYHLVQDAQKINAKPIGIYIISLKFLESHLESALKVQFIQNTLKVLRESLSKLNIPLSIIYLDDSKDKYKLSSNSYDSFKDWLTALLNEKFQTNSIYYNVNYEYDELNRDISLLSSNLNIKAFHDQCIVKPMQLTSGKGTQYSKFSPWFKKWDSYLNSSPIELLQIQHKFEKWDWSHLPNDDDYKLPPQFQVSSLKEVGVTDIGNFENLKGGEDEALEKLEKWISNSIKEYQSEKDYPSLSSTSRLSPYITQGSISPRLIVTKCQEANNNKRIGGNTGIETFIKEVAWRDFYRHVTVNWPYLMMFVPFNLGLIDLKWSDDYSRFEKWCLGETGFPIVDASMKCLLHTGYMNNRCRMVVSSFLSKDLAMDWRMGELWFYNHLIDADLSSNNGGWGFSSSTGLDAQPWFRIFNVYTQSEKFDPDGVFIKKWLPNLSKLENFHEPYNEKIDAKEIEKLTNGYPKPIIDRKQAREETLERYREAM
ncbi:unnamed protein product [Wickerhamomyces anomalus]